MRLRLPGTFFNRYEGRFAGVPSARVWKWTPATVIVFLAFSRAIMTLPVHPFFALIAMVIIPTIIVALCKFFIPVRLAWPLEWITGGIGFALLGGTLAWWVYAIALYPDLKNKLQLCVLIGFWACSFILLGCCTVTAVVLGFLSREPLA